MRLLHLVIAAAVVAAGTTWALAQNAIAGAAPAMNRASGSAPSEAEAAMERAATAGKFVFLFFWKDKTPQVDKAWSILQPAMANMADSAETVSIRITDPAEKRLIEKYDVSRVPMPLVLAIAPCGAITKAFVKTFDENQLRTAFVSPCTQLCLKALQSRKLVLACVVDRRSSHEPVTIPKAAEDFKADAQFGPATEVVVINAQDQAEASFLKNFQVDPQAQKPVIVFLAPPGSVIGRFNGTATKQQLLAQLAAAQSNPCAGGKCGPGGCGPKK